MSSAEKNEFEKQHEMKTYFMVFLKPGPIRDQDTQAAAALQKQHISHLMNMVNTGKMDIVGPLLDDSDILGICIYNVATADEAEQLAKQDPAVLAGRLIVETHPFYSAKGSTLK